MSEFVTTAVTSGIGTLVLSRPPSNALTRQMYREILAAANELAQRADIVSVILFGGHEVFSVGDDVQELRRLDNEDMPSVATACRAAVDAVAAIPKPTVAAITGYALGSGLTLALAADRRVSGDNVKVGVPEVLDGLVPAGGTTRLVRAIGVPKTKDLIFSGRFAGAEEALAIGLIDEAVAPDGVYDAAVTWAKRFVDAQPHVLAAAKAMIDSDWAGPSADRGR